MRSSVGGAAASRLFADGRSSGAVLDLQRELCLIYGRGIVRIRRVNRGKLAAIAAAAGVVLAALAVVQAAVFAATGAYLAIVAPLVGLPVALAVYRALHRLCNTGSRLAEATALAGIWFLVGVAIMGISFGGLPLILPAIVLALAAALTPRPVTAQRQP
jgi:hypothetical protein